MTEIFRLSILIKKSLPSGKHALLASRSRPIRPGLFVQQLPILTEHLGLPGLESVTGKTVQTICCLVAEQRTKPTPDRQ